VRLSEFAPPLRPLQSRFLVVSSRGITQRNAIFPIQRTGECEKLNYSRVLPGYYIPSPPTPQPPPNPHPFPIFVARNRRETVFEPSSSSLSRFPLISPLLRAPSLSPAPSPLSALSQVDECRFALELGAFLAPPSFISRLP